MESSVDQTHRQDVLLTYRGLRIGLVGAAGFLALSVLYEMAASGTVRESVSAYWYTPARPVLVGSLIAIGLALIVLTGTTPGEDTLLSLTGILAPLVAIVPTVRLGEPNLTDPATLALVANNVTALLGVGAAGILLTAWLLRTGSTLPRAGSPAHIGLLVAGLVYVVTLVTFVFARSTFTKWTHNVAAVGMLVCMALAVWLAARPPRTDRGWKRPRWLTASYRALSILMVAVLAGAVAARIANLQWGQVVLVVEIIEVTAFAVFWSLQTWEHWYDDPTVVEVPVR